MDRDYSTNPREYMASFYLSLQYWAEKFNLSDDQVNVLFLNTWLESSGIHDADAATSSAYGVSQTIDATRISLQNAYPDLNEGDLPLEHPHLQAGLVAAHAYDSLQRLSQSLRNRGLQEDGIEPDAAFIRLQHFLGAPQAVAVLVAHSQDEAMALNRILPDSVMNSNGGIVLPEHLDAGAPRFADWTVDNIVNWAQTELVRPDILDEAVAALMIVNPDRSDNEIREMLRLSLPMPSPYAPMVSLIPPSRPADLVPPSAETLVAASEPDPAAENATIARLAPHMATLLGSEGEPLRESLAHVVAGVVVVSPSDNSAQLFDLSGDMALRQAALTCLSAADGLLLGGVLLENNTADVVIRTEQPFDVQDCDVTQTGRLQPIPVVFAGNQDTPSRDIRG